MAFKGRVFHIWYLSPEIDYHTRMTLSTLCAHSKRLRTTSSGQQLSYSITASNYEYAHGCFKNRRNHILLRIKFQYNDDYEYDAQRVFSVTILVIV